MKPAAELGLGGCVGLTNRIACPLDCARARVERCACALEGLSHGLTVSPGFLTLIIGSAANFPTAASEVPLRLISARIGNVEGRPQRRIEMSDDLFWPPASGGDAERSGQGEPVAYGGEPTTALPAPT